MEEVLGTRTQLSVECVYQPLGSAHSSAFETLETHAFSCEIPSVAPLAMQRIEATFHLVASQHSNYGGSEKYL